MKEKKLDEPKRALILLNPDLYCLGTLTILDLFLNLYYAHL